MKHTKQEQERGYTDKDAFSAGVVIAAIVISAALLIVGAFVG